MHDNKYIDIYNRLIDFWFPRFRFVFRFFLILDKVLHLIAFFYFIFLNEAIKTKMKSCGCGVRLNGRIVMTDPKGVIFGDNVHINSGAYLRTEGGLEIGDNVHISSNITIYTRNQRYNGDLLPYDSVNINKPVLICRNVWVGMNVSIAPGVTIGEGSVIGIGAVVTRDVAPFEIVGPEGPMTIGRRDREHYRRLEKEKLYGGASGYVNKNLS